MHVPRFTILMTLCALILSLAPAAFAQQGAPVLETVEDSSSGTARLTWTNDADHPTQFLGFAWDVYTEDWVERGLNDSIWYNFQFNESSASYTDTMDLGHSGAYFAWISNYYADGDWLPCENPATLQLLSGTPHKPIDVQAVQTEDNKVSLSWKSDPYGTWLYWIIAYDHFKKEWVTTQGPLGESLWHYVAYGNEDFTSGTTTMTVPERGAYWFYVAAMGWDAETWSEFGTTFVSVAPAETIMLPGDIPLEMVQIPTGSFLMGRYPGEQDSYDREDPQHRVTIAYDFQIGKIEVTKAQWEAVMGTTPWSGHLNVLDVSYSPAIFITWKWIIEPDGFIEKLNEHLLSTGQGPAICRLPSEAEWEYACRAGTTTRFYWGDDQLYTQTDAYSWYNNNTWDTETYAHVVGQKLPNAWGLFDMIGNVEEYCMDRWHDNYSGAPTNGDSWGTPDGKYSFYPVTRGGSWRDVPRYCRSSYRTYRSPGQLSTNIGFRLVRDIE